jgi:hypothetical protein
MKKINFPLGCCFLLGSLFFAACGGPSAQQACNDRAKAACNLLNSCRQNGATIVYGTLGICITQLANECMTGLIAPGTASSPGSVENCAKALPSESCQNYLQNNPVSQCLPQSGSNPDGAACAFNAQCQHAFCAIPAGTVCGTCQGPPAIGDSCASTPCGYNQVCTPSQVCAAYVASGGACDTMNNICAPHLACVIAAGMNSGTCQTKLTTAGAACDSKLQTAPDCDVESGLYCDGTSKMCVAYTYAVGGMPCGSMNNGAAYALCESGLCYDDGSGSGAMCVPTAGVGESCDTMMGPTCLAPGVCAISGGTSGTCTALDGTMCM